MSSKGILQINDILNDYNDEIQEGISEIAQEVAKEDVRKLKAANTYKVRSGEYNKSWTTTTKRSQNSISCIVHNKKHYRLTHLLEYGHRIKRDGTIRGNARAFPHIAPVEELSNNTFQQKVEQLIRNGG